MKSLKVALIQTELYWENKPANYAHFEEIIMGLNQPIDIIVLPEMFSTGFSMDVKKLAEPINLHTTKWMKQVASSSQSVLCGSFIITEGGNFYNRFIAVDPKGNIICQYDKQYLFPLSFEHTSFSPGSSQTIFEVKGFKIKPQICYDLRFPESSRYYETHPQDILLYVANWPSKRQEHWNTLLKARAIENQCFVLACNRVGQDGNDLTYTGGSQVITSEGSTLISSNEEDVLITSITDESQDIYREKFPVLKSIKPYFKE